MSGEPIDAGKRGPLRPGEVCSLLGIQPYVLKFWEAEIPLLGDRVGGRRRYGPEELEIARAIREFLVEKRMTLREAREALRERFPAAEPREEAGAGDGDAAPGTGNGRRRGATGDPGDVPAARVRRLERELGKTREALDRAREEIAALETRVREAEELARRLSADRERERDAAREREGALEERVASLEKILAAERAAREKALAQAARVPELLGRIASLEADVTRVEDERDRLAEQLATAREEVERLAQEVDAVAGERDRLAEDLRRLRAEARAREEESRGAVRQAREEVDALRAEAASARARADRAVAETTAFRERLLDELAAAREELGGLHAELDAFLVGLPGAPAGEDRPAGGTGGEAPGDAADERDAPGTLFDP